MRKQLHTINAALLGHIGQICCSISSLCHLQLYHHCQGGNNLEQSLIASGVNGRKWVGCGGKPHIPANCSNTQEANCQFDGVLWVIEVGLIGRLDWRPSDKRVVQEDCIYWGEEWTCEWLCRPSLTESNYTFLLEDLSKVILYMEMTVTYV